MLPGGASPTKPNVAAGMKYLRGMKFMSRKEEAAVRERIMVSAPAGATSTEPSSRGSRGDDASIPAGVSVIVDCSSTVAPAGGRMRFGDCSRKASSRQQEVGQSAQGRPSADRGITMLQPDDALFGGSGDESDGSCGSPTGGDRSKGGGGGGRFYVEGSVRAPKLPKSLEHEMERRKREREEAEDDEDVGAQQQHRRGGRGPPGGRGPSTRRLPQKSQHQRYDDGSLGEDDDE